MAKVKKDTKAGLKWKRKKWYVLQAPKFFNERPVGETMSLDEESLNGKMVNVNLMELTGDIKKQNTILKLKVIKVTGLTASTESVGFHMVPASIKRIVRRNRNRIDDSFTCKTSDGRIVRVKPLIITRDSTSRSVVSALRKNMRESIVRKIAKMKLEQLMNDLVTYKLQRTVRDELKRIYPLRSCEMRVLKEEENAKKVLLPTPEPERKPKEEPSEGEEA